MPALVEWPRLGKGGAVLYRSAGGTNVDFSGHDIHNLNILRIAATSGMAAGNVGTQWIFLMKSIPTPGRTMPSGDTLSPGCSFMPDFPGGLGARWDVSEAGLPLLGLRRPKASPDTSNLSRNARKSSLFAGSRPQPPTPLRVAHRTNLSSHERDREFLVVH